MNAAKRLDDFDRRARLAADDLLRHAIHGWRYVPVHPFADDAALLQKFGLSSDACRKVDAYWVYAGDVYFLQVQPPWSGGPSTGLYYRWCDASAYVVNVVAIVEETPIYRKDFEKLMTIFSELLPVKQREPKLTLIGRTP